jgi:hypothetical protein
MLRNLRYLSRKTDSLIIFRFFYKLFLTSDVFCYIMAFGVIDEDFGLNVRVDYFVNSEGIMMKRRVVAVLFVVAFLFSAQASAVVHVKDIQLGLNMSTWYDGFTPSPAFQLVDTGSNSSVVGILPNMGVVNTWEATFYSYRIVDATFTMSANTLISDNNPGGAGGADGTFTGGSVLAIEGSIVEVDGVGNPIGPASFTGTLLSAQMDADTWDLEEDALLINSVRGDQGFTVTGGELATGAISGLKMLDFNGVFTMDLNLTTISDFGPNMYMSALPQIQFVAPVPEPATMLLLLAGGILVRSRKS